MNTYEAARDALLAIDVKYAASAVVTMEEILSAIIHLNKIGKPPKGTKYNDTFLGEARVVAKSMVEFMEKHKVWWSIPEVHTHLLKRAKDSLKQDTEYKALHRAMRVLNQVNHLTALISEFDKSKWELTAARTRLLMRFY